MKQLFAFLCALAMMFALAACTATESVDSSSTGNSTPPAQTVPQSGASTDTTAGGPALSAFEEIVVVDDENCTIKITGLDPENLWGYTLNVYLENKSADKTFMFSVDSASINGVSADPFFASEVAPGKKANDEISFATEELEENNVGRFTDIQLDFRVYDSNDWTADDIALAGTHVYPYGEENAVRFVREAQPGDMVLVDNDYVTVTVTGFEHDDIWGYMAKLFVVNKSDVSIMLTADEVSVNGFMADPFFAHSVSAGTCAFTSMTWSDSVLEENNITDIESISFILRVYDDTDWTADDFVNQSVTLNP